MVATDRTAAIAQIDPSYLLGCANVPPHQTWNWVIGSPGQYVIWVIGSPGHHFDPV